jgi:ABC-type branched-subunit amino acid transport system ATPase component
MSGPEAGGRAPSDPAGPAALRADEVSVRFGGVAAVSDATIAVAPGACHGIVGANGAGKTTLLNALSGVVRVQSGSILLDDRRIDRLSPRRRRYAGLARTFQNPALVPDLSVLDNVKVGVFPVERWSAWRDVAGPLLARSGERRTTQAAERALDAVRVPRAVWSRPAAGLSHGDQKIVDLARALAGRPRALLLDEPTAGLTVGEMDFFAEVLGEQLRSGLVTIVVVSHHMKFLSSLAATVTVMDSGRVMADGSFEEVTARPDVVASFLGEIDAAI